jgi:protein-disulfide isomerase
MQFMDQKTTSVPSNPNGQDPPAPVITVRRTLRRPPPPSIIDWSKWLVLVAVFFFGFGAGWLVWGQSGASPGSAVTVNQDLKRYNVPTDGDPSIGPENAPITIVEFSDYQCPYCAKWYQEVSPRLLEFYKDKVRLVYRNFPLYSIHPEAEPAAEAAKCAGEQNTYWPFHDALFGQKYGLSSAAYVKYATGLGLNLDQFNKCMSEKRYKSEIDADYQFASGIGVSSTPSFFINGIAVVGAQPFEVFQQIIDKELADQIPK